MVAQSQRSFPILSSGCANQYQIPSTAQAYSLNITVVPTNGYLDYLTAWPTPTGQGQPPGTSTLNSLDGRVIANAAIVPAGSGGAVSIYVSDETDVIIDIDGYFAPPGPGGLAFFPVSPCRAASTVIYAGTSPSFGIGSEGACPPFPSAAAYSLNVTAIPPSQEYLYLTIWPAGQSPPNVSTLNSTDGAGVSNTALVAAGSGGAVQVSVYSQATVYLDVNGYFAPVSSAPGGELFYPLTPCRVADTRTGYGFTGNFGPPSLTGGSLSGSVTDQQGRPLAGAQVRYLRIAQYVHASNGFQPAPGEAMANGLVSADANASFTLASLPVGSYTLCASVPSAPYLDPCVWGQAVRATISTGSTTSTTLVLQEGVFLDVRINDPLQLLPQAVDGGLRPRKMVVGVVYANGAYQGAQNTDAGTTGRDYQMTVPAGTPFKLWLFSRDVALTDASGNPVASSGAQVPFQAVAGQEQTFTFTVAGPAIAQ